LSLENTNTDDTILKSNDVHSAGQKTKEATTENDDDSHKKVECKEAGSSTAGSPKASHATSTAGNAFEKGKEGLSDVRRDKTSSAHPTAVVYEKQRTGLSDTKQETIPSADRLSTTQDGETSPSERMTTDGVIISADLVRRDKTVFSPTNSGSSAQETSSVGKTSCEDDKQDAGVAELKETGSISAASYPSTLRRKTSPVEFLANADTKELSSGTVKTGKTLLSTQEVLPREKEKMTFGKDQLSRVFNKDETMAFDKGIKGFGTKPFDADAQMETLSPGNSANFLKVQ